MKKSIDNKKWILSFRIFSTLTLYLLSSAPLFWIICLLTFYFKAASILGYYPSYDHPDPKVLSIYDDYANLIRFTGDLWIWCLIGWISLASITIVVTRKNVFWKPLAFSSIPHLLGIILLFSDIATWFWD